MKNSSDSGKYLSAEQGTLAVVSVLRKKKKTRTFTKDHSHMYELIPELQVVRWKKKEKNSSVWLLYLQHTSSTCRWMQPTQKINKRLVRICFDVKTLKKNVSTGCNPLHNDEKTKRFFFKLKILQNYWITYKIFCYYLNNIRLIYYTLCIKKKGCSDYVGFFWSLVLWHLWDLVIKVNVIKAILFSKYAYRIQNHL